MKTNNYISVTTVSSVNINNHGSFQHYLTHNEMISRLGCKILCKSLYQFCHPKPRVAALVHENAGKATRDEISELFYSRIVIKIFSDKHYDEI